MFTQLIPQEWSNSHFFLDYQNIVKWTGEENKENHELKILSWSTNIKKKYMSASKKSSHF